MVRKPEGYIESESESEDDSQIEIIGASDSSEEEIEDDSSSSISESGESEVNDTSNENHKERNNSKLNSKKTTFQGDEDVRAEGEYSSDEEHEKNTIGNVPLHWYDEFDHIGYDKSGKKIEKPQGMNELEKYLASKDDPFYRRSVYDEKNDRNIVLTDRELIMVRRMLESKFPEVGFNAEQEYIDYYTSEKMETPLSSTHEPKRRFVPSKWERMKIIKIANGIRAGDIKVGQKPPPKKPDFFLIWGEDDRVQDYQKRRGPKYIPAPKVAPPGHVESYHPPQEYLPTQEEIDEWKNAHEDDRKLNFLPSDFKIMRKVPGYENFIKERFERCMDLYMCPRAERRRLNIDPESLVPKLPSPEELRPFPNAIAVNYFGNYTTRVRSLAVSPLGDLVATGSDDCIVRIYEVDSGRCLATYDLSSKDVPKTKEDDDEDSDNENGSSNYISKIAWNPQPCYRVIAVAINNRIELVHAGVASCCPPEHSQTTFELLTGAKVQNDTSLEDLEEDERTKHREAIEKSALISEWTQHGDMAHASSMIVGNYCRTTMQFKDSDSGDIVDLAWHGKGEYLASVSTAKKYSAQVTVHHVSKRLSQRPLKTDSSSRVQRILFHPQKPILFVALQREVEIYHLLKQSRIRKLPTGSRWLSSLAIHPTGDHVIVGSYDKRLTWFDLEMSSKPFKTLKYHKLAIRNVCFHRRYPLMASCADDGNIHIFHARVFDDFAKDPYIVPVKVLRGHTQMTDGLGVLDCVFHPEQPWIFTAGADGRVQLFQNLG